MVLEITDRLREHALICHVLGFITSEIVNSRLNFIETVARLKLVGTSTGCTLSHCALLSGRLRPAGL